MWTAHAIDICGLGLDRNTPNHVRAHCIADREFEAAVRIE